MCIASGNQYFSNTVDSLRGKEFYIYDFIDEHASLRGKTQIIIGDE